MKVKRKDHTTKLFNKLKHPLQQNMLWFFSDEKNFCHDQMVNLQNNCWLAVSTRCTNNDENQTHRSASWCLAGSLVKGILYLQSPFPMASDSTQRLASIAWKRQCFSWLRGWLLEDSVSSNRTLCYATQIGELNLGSQKISTTTLPLTSNHLTPQNTIPL